MVSAIFSNVRRSSRRSAPKEEVRATSAMKPISLGSMRCWDDPQHERQPGVCEDSRKFGPLCSSTRC